MYSDFESSLRALNPDFKSHLFPEIYDIVTKYYSEPTRFYHTNHHIIDCLTKMHKHFTSGPFAPIGDNDLPHLTLALIYHDVIYDPKSSNNEHASAVLARNHLEMLGLADADIHVVFNLIMATKSHKHKEPAGENGSYGYLEDMMVDIDMSILASDKSVYEVYANEIYQEYSFLGRETYVVKRKAVLEQILADGKIFRFGEVFDEKKVAENIEFEINDILK